MVSIPKVVGILSCGFVLCLGLSNAASAADEMKSGQDARKGEQSWSEGRSRQAKGRRNESGLNCEERRASWREGR